MYNSKSAFKTLIKIFRHFMLLVGLGVMPTLKFNNIYKALTAVRKGVVSKIRGISTRAIPDIDTNKFDYEIQNTCQCLSLILSECQQSIDNAGYDPRDRDNCRINHLNERAIIFASLLNKIVQVHKKHCRLANKMAKKMALSNEYEERTPKKDQTKARNIQNKSMNNFINVLRNVTETGQSLQSLLDHLKLEFKYFGHSGAKKKSTFDGLRQLRIDFDDIVSTILITLETINEKLYQLAQNLEKIDISWSNENHNQVNSSVAEADKWKEISASMSRTLRKILWAKTTVSTCRDAQDGLEHKFQRYLDDDHERVIRIQQWLALMVLFILSYLLLIQQLLAMTWAMTICNFLTLTLFLKLIIMIVSSLPLLQV
ncbi:hypothetical protein CHUAL_013083 [Chamberlinius hualienensis]